MRKPRYRKAQRDALREQGIPPVAVQRACCVRVVNTTIIPAWLDSRLIPGLASVRGLYWLKHSDAIALASFLRGISVWYDVTEVEFKRCARCFRPLVGLDAITVRKMMATVADRQAVSCGAACDKDNESGIWRRLGVLKVAA